MLWSWSLISSELPALEILDALIQLEHLLDGIGQAQTGAGVGFYLDDFAKKGHDCHLGQADLVNKEHQAKDDEQNKGDGKC